MAADGLPQSLPRGGTGLNLPPLGWGGGRGECRIEVDADAQLLGYGAIKVAGHAKLFEARPAVEGFEEVYDLGDIEAFSIFVLRNPERPTWPAESVVKLDDSWNYATVTFTLYNWDGDLVG
jgi:hypothetical protein